MSYTLLRDKWVGPNNEVFISFDVYDEKFSMLMWNSDWIDVTNKLNEFDLNEIRDEIIKQCKVFKLTADLTSDLITEWGEDWKERKKSWNTAAVYHLMEP